MVNSIKFLVIGDIPLATQVFRFLNQVEKVQIVAIFTQYLDKQFLNDPWEDNTSLYQEAQKYDYPIFHNQNDLISQYPEGFFDFGISCRASIIYDPEFLKLFSKYLINMHGGILPKRAGLHVSCHCILEGDTVSGGTLHIINDKIDDGDILARNEFPILSKDTSFDVYQKTQIALLDLFTTNFQNIIDNKIKPLKQSYYIKNGETRKYYNKNDIYKKKEVDILNINKEELDRIVRGLDFPGHEPAFVKINGNKIYLTTRSFYKNER